MIYRTYTLEDTAKGKNPSFGLVCWPQEDNKLSIVPVKKIVSPSPADLAPEAFCKVRGLEDHLCKVVALGTEADMKARLDGGVDVVDKSPPRKRACTRKGSTQKKGKGKENKTPQLAKRKVNKQGRILLVGAKPLKLSEDSQGQSQDQPPASEPKQSQDQPSASDEPKQSGDQPSASEPKQSGDQQPASESGDQPSASEPKQSRDQPSASVESKQSQDQLSAPASNGEGTELPQHTQPEDVVSPRGGPTDFISLSPYESMEDDDVGKNSLFLCMF